MYHTSVIVQVIPTHHFHDNVTSWAAPAHLTDTVPSVLIKSTPAISITETWAAIYWRKKEKVKKETIVEEFFSLPVKLQLFNDILQSLLPKKESNTAPLHDIHTLGWIWKNTCTYPYLYLPRNHLSLRSEDFFSVQLFVHRQKWINV